MSAASATTSAFAQPRVRSRSAERATGLAFVAADSLALYTAFAITVIVRGAVGTAPLWPTYLRLIPFLAAIPVLIALLGLYPGVLLNPVDEFRRLTIAIGVGMSLVVVATFLLKGANIYSRAVFLAAIPLTAGLALWARWLVRTFCSKMSWWGIPTVLVGPLEQVEAMRRTVEARPQTGIRTAGVIIADRDWLPSGPEKYLGGGAIPYALVVIPAGTDARWMLQVERLVWGCRKIIVVPQSMELLWSWMEIRDCCGTVGLEVGRALLRRRARFAKRVMDVVLALGGGALILPLFAAIAMLLKLSSKGPVFYSQARVGEGGATFQAWKFRTMVQHADDLLEQCLQTDPALRAEWSAQHKLRNDPRVTLIGRFLRQTSLDELPQIWNVIRGEMSMVGPRPIVADEVVRYGEEFDLYQKVMPGITGQWQVSGRSDTSYERRVAMDVHYVRNWSVWLDVYLLFRTVGVVLRKKGAY
jgi:Undecaprenyl-phosphate galactose phosphotransferase WbaP